MQAQPLRPHACTWYGVTVLLAGTQRSPFPWRHAELPAEERERLEQEQREYIKLQNSKQRAKRKQEMKGECCKESNDES